jgi:lipoic acid synthetase
MKPLHRAKQAVPPWVRARVPADAETRIAEMRELLASFRLHTVCQSARCPNMASCFTHGVATFMILGDVCTRRCRFCATSKGRPAEVDPGEPDRVAEAASRLGLNHVVITSVTRDDLADGGASQFARAVVATRLRNPKATIEVLVPDMRGSREALGTIVESTPDIVGHNIETVPRLFPRIRPGGSFETSLHVLRTIKELNGDTISKSGFMVGLGEQEAEVHAMIESLRSTGCDVLTVGQYLRPSRYQLAVSEYIHPLQFEDYRRHGQALGFAAVVSEPLARSSLHAALVARQLLSTPDRRRRSERLIA